MGHTRPPRGPSKETLMGMIQEFKEFAMKGNVVDMAVGVVIGAAFGKIVSALVGKVIMPIVGGLSAGVDFAKAQTTIANPNPSGEPIEVVYGEFVQATIDFIIVAAVLFVVIKLMNSMKKKEEAAPEKTPEDIELLREIRDSLKKA